MKKVGTPISISVSSESCHAPYTIRYKLTLKYIFTLPLFSVLSYTLIQTVGPGERRL